MHIAEGLKRAKKVADNYPYRVGAGLAPALVCCLPWPISLSCTALVTFKKRGFP